MKLIQSRDVESLIRNTDLLVLIGSEVALTRQASTDGGEYAGPCAVCGGRDRFRVWPKSQRPRFWCRACGIHGDVISWVRWRHGLSFQDACRLLGSRERFTRAGPGPSHPARPSPVQPSPAWQQQAEQLVRDAEETLWSPSGERARRWLAARGLTDDTIHGRRLGLIASDGFLEAGAWGLTGRLWLDRGVLIPWIEDGAPWLLKLRRPAGEPKYRRVRGGDQPGLYGAETLDGNSEVFLVEGEFDVMVLRQEAGHLVDVATLGSSMAGLTERAIRALLPYATIYVAYDTDQAGERGADRLLKASRRMRRVRVPSGKDVTAFHQQGGSLVAWVRFEQARRAYQQGHLTIPAAPGVRPVQNPDRYGRDLPGDEPWRCIRSDCDRPVGVPEHSFLCSSHGEEAAVAAAQYAAEQGTDAEPPHDEAAGVAGQDTGSVPVSPVAAS